MRKRTWRKRGGLLTLLVIALLCILSTAEMLITIRGDKRGVTYFVGSKIAMRAQLSALKRSIKSAKAGQMEKASDDLSMVRENMMDLRPKDRERIVSEWSTTSYQVGEISEHQALKTLEECVALIEAGDLDAARAKLTSVSTAVDLSRGLGCSHSPALHAKTVRMLGNDDLHLVE